MCFGDPRLSISSILKRLQHSLRGKFSSLRQFSMRVGLRPKPIAHAFVDGLKKSPKAIALNGHLVRRLETRDASFPLHTPLHLCITSCFATERYSSSMSWRSTVIPWYVALFCSLIPCVPMTVGCRYRRFEQGR